MEVWEAAYRLEDEIDIIARPDLYLEQFHRADPVWAHLYVMYVVINWIAADGLFFVMSQRYGQILPEAIEGFRRIGMPQTAEVLAQAAARVATPFPRGTVLRDKRLAESLARISDEEVNAGVGWSIEEAGDIFEQFRKEKLFEDLETLYFRLEETENGGFEAAALAYLSVYRPGWIDTYQPEKGSSEATMTSARANKDES